MKQGTYARRGLSLLLVAGMALAFGACKNEPDTAKTTKSPAIVQENKKNGLNTINPLTGESGFSPDAVGKRPIAVMINNAPAARPQWGLCSPDIVIEGLAEGGVTRMMWLYADAGSIPEKVGSVRSARHDFVELAEGLDAIFVHWGGSTMAYDALRERNVDHIDGMRYSSTYFARDKTRTTAVEHRGYTSGSNITRAIEKMELRTKAKNGASFEFVQNAPRELSGAACPKIKVSFSADYNHTFAYSDADGLYYNYMNANKMTEDGGKQMAVSNVFVLYAPVSTIDNKGHVDMNLSGGEGFYVSHGKMEKITWKKGTARNPLKLYTQSGEALKINPGKSWIGFIPEERAAKTIVETEI